MKKHAFEKFIKSEPTGAKKKEMIRQEKRKVKREARDAADIARKRKREGGYGETFSGNETYGRKKGSEYTRNTPANAAKQWPKKDNSTGAPKGKNKTAGTPDKKFSVVKKRDAKQKPPFKSKPAAGDTEFIKQAPSGNTVSHNAEPMPLNKFISHAGICSRREAAELVKQGKVSVNGAVVNEPGFKVSATDKVKANGKLLFLQHNLVYLLLNKPKDYITTAKDPEGRKTVFDLLKNATKERIYPVGRLDRNTTGVLLLTNDGELAQKLTHPSFEVKKVYEVKLDKPLVKKDFEAILNGVTLEDGFVIADTLAYADSKDKSVVGIEIHSGRNRIVRRLFEHLGYDVKNLDRVMFANLTKKNVDRGKWRFLNEKEVRLLKYMNQSFVRKSKNAASDNADES
ncbi:MAG TPA: pseudouridine synthase [Chitinophagaceae bacterium]|nr:pseudouridine synthase [Chitinophagaceae bacterium]